MESLTSHIFESENLVVKANYSDWNKAKQQLSKQYPFNAPLYIHAEKPAALTVEDIIRLRDFLNEKIDFLGRVQE